jgi:hypothetical protein
MEWSKDLEEKYQSMAILVETLSQLNFKKNEKIKQLKKKVQKYKSLAKAKKLRTNPLPTTTPDGKHVIIYQELLDLTEEPDFEQEEEVVIIEKKNIKIKIKEETNPPIAPPSTPNNEVIEIEEEDEKGEDIEDEEEEEEEEVEIVIEKEVVEEDIEPALEPDSEEEAEPEPEMQPTEEPVLEKEEEEVAAEEAEEELYETTINGKAYYVTNETNGPIYAIAEDEEVGDEIGKFVNGKAIFQESSTAPEATAEEVELYQIKINGIEYAVENETNGPIYELIFDGDVGEQVGKYVNGKPTFNKK